MQRSKLRNILRKLVDMFEIVYRLSGEEAGTRSDSTLSQEVSSSLET